MPSLIHKKPDNNVYIVMACYCDGGTHHIVDCYRSSTRAIRRQKLCEKKKPMFDYQIFKRRLLA